MDLQLVLPFLVFQDTSQDLPAGALRDLRNKLNPTLQPLVPRLVLLNMLADGGSQLEIRLLTSLYAFHYKGFRDLTGQIVGNWDDSAVVDEVVGEDMGLQLRWGNLITLSLVSAMIRELGGLRRNQNKSRALP